ncbi:hypothetical protein HZB08_01700 [Candidatus Saganbacteria bacterium]|uniref:RNA polymerase sigma-70 region 2 domain-containing protein n=1 Tax=Candidatus Saganbacteria bacterium TaxID=2575572 RepID=A0A9D6YT08_UNCSA|nr:hypothetical protein [Candidatus Saganbacteria bacterium]
MTISISLEKLRQANNQIGCRPKKVVKVPNEITGEIGRPARLALKAEILREVPSIKDKLSLFFWYRKPADEILLFKVYGVGLGLEGAGIEEMIKREVKNETQRTAFLSIWYDCLAKAWERALPNQPLVKSVAKKYEALTFNDRVQSGMIGLLRAALIFDPERGSEFSTFAYPSIKWEIQRAIANQSRAVRIPVTRRRVIAQFNRLEGQLSEQRDRELTVGEMADYLGVSIEEIQQIGMDAAPILSLENPQRDDEMPLTSTMEDTSIPDTLSPVDKEKLKEILTREIDGLPYQMSFVLRESSGLGGKPKTNDEISRLVGQLTNTSLTANRIRQVRREGLDLLRDRLLEKYPYLTELMGK